MVVSYRAREEMKDQMEEEMEDEMVEERKEGILEFVEDEQENLEMSR